MMSYKFPAQARIKHKDDFQSVFQNGKRLTNVFPLYLYYLERPGAKTSRLGLAIGIKTGPAAVRNRWKRIIREAFRKHQKRLCCPCDIVALVSRNADENDMVSAEPAFINAIILINNRKKKTPEPFHV